MMGNKKSSLVLCPDLLGFHFGVSNPAAPFQLGSSIISDVVTWYRVHLSKQCHHSLVAPPRCPVVHG